MSRRAVLGAKLLVAFAIVTWLIQSGKLDMRRLKSLRNGPALAVLVGLRVLASLLPVVRWQLVVRGQGHDFPLQQAVHVGLIGNFFNSITPSTLGQDGARLYYGRQLHVANNAALVCSIAADRLIGLAALAMLGVVFGGLYHWHLAAGMSSWLAVTPLVFLSGLVVCTAAAIGGLSALRGRLPETAKLALSAIGQLKSRPGLLVAIVLLSLAGHLAIMGSYYCAFVTLGGSPPLLAVLAISPALTLLRGLPLTPMSLGVMEWASELLYSLAGQSDGAEVVLVTRAVTLLFGLVCGLLFFVPLESKGRHEIE
jgi:uncharacterized membrane protein YbhN (UPF0104 family)